eukprot:8083772-Lingulodinium_polyedra.AAC.1
MRELVAEDGGLEGLVVDFIGPVAKVSNFFGEIAANGQDGAVFVWVQGGVGCSMLPAGDWSHGKRGPIHFPQVGWRTAQRRVMAHALE